MEFWKLFKRDAYGQMYARLRGMYGSTPKDVAVDVNGNIVSLMKGTDGTDLQTILVDSTGKIIGVMKGDYSGTLKTIAVDTNGRMLANISTMSAYDTGITREVETSTLAAASTETITITPPSSYLYKILNIGFTVMAPSGSASGTHWCTMGVWNNSENTWLDYLSKGVSNYNGNLNMSMSYWQVADNDQQPTTEIGQITKIQGAIISPGNPLRFQYRNYSDVDQTHVRTYTIGYQRIQI